jgi:hypothetical protein
VTACDINVLASFDKKRFANRASRFGLKPAVRLH